MPLSRRAVAPGGTLTFAADAAEAAPGEPLEPCSRHGFMDSAGSHLANARMSAVSLGRLRG